jgi:uncharacterized repeat protein (TIGR01451 family)
LFAEARWVRALALGVFVLVWIGWVLLRHSKNPRLSATRLLVGLSIAAGAGLGVVALLPSTRAEIPVEEPTAAVVTVDLKNVSLQKRTGELRVWSPTELADPADTLSVLITVRNNSALRLDELTVSSALPPGVVLVSGSVQLTDGANSGVEQRDDALFTTGGLNFKSYAPSSVLYVRYQVVVLESACASRLRFLGFARAAKTTERAALADLTVEPCT